MIRTLPRGHRDSRCLLGREGTERFPASLPEEGYGYQEDAACASPLDELHRSVRSAEPAIRETTRTTTPEELRLPPGG